MYLSLLLRFRPFESVGSKVRIYVLRCVGRVLDNSQHVILCAAQMFSRAKRGLQSIQSQTKNTSEQERRVAKNVTQSLAITLQELSSNFRKSQSSYLKSKCVRLVGRKKQSIYMPTAIHIVSIPECMM